jgi:ribose 1,5-bisphosphokinase
MKAGPLIYVVGASGSGKDSVLGAARKLCGQGAPIAFAHRYITRPFTKGGENHVELSREEFAARLDHGFFAMSWDSHGLRYGIGIEVNAWMRKGFAVVVNGSREFLPQAAEIYGNMIVCNIWVERELLLNRLLSRGRESREEIARRIERSEAIPINHPNTVTIDNSGALDDAVNNFVELAIGAAKEAVY